MFIFDNFTAGATNPNDFFLSDNGDGLSMGLRFQQTGPLGEDSGKIGKLTVPEPTTVVYLLCGVIGIICLRRR
jgi:hypothetical protein